jgi:hypothetical protein
MAQRTRFRFAVLDVELAKTDFSLASGHLAGAIKTGLQDNWGEIGAFVVAPFLRLVSLEKIGSRRFLAILRYPRDYQVEVLSTCALLWTIADVVAAVRLRKVIGNIRNADKEVKLLRQALTLKS